MEQLLEQMAQTSLTQSKNISDLIKAVMALAEENKHLMERVTVLEQARANDYGPH